MAGMKEIARKRYIIKKVIATVLSKSFGTIPVLKILENFAMKINIQYINKNLTQVKGNLYFFNHNFISKEASIGKRFS